MHNVVFHNGMSYQNHFHVSIWCSWIMNHDIHLSIHPFCMQFPQILWNSVGVWKNVWWLIYFHVATSVPRSVFFTHIIYIIYNILYIVDCPCWFFAASRDSCDCIRVCVCVCVGDCRFNDLGTAAGTVWMLHFFIACFFFLTADKSNECHSEKQAVTPAIISGRTQWQCTRLRIMC